MGLFSSQASAYPLLCPATGTRTQIDNLFLSPALLSQGNQLALFNSVTQKPQHVRRVHVWVFASLLRQVGPIAALGGLRGEDLPSFLRFKVAGLGVPMHVIEDAAAMVEHKEAAVPGDHVNVVDGETLVSCHWVAGVELGAEAGGGHPAPVS